MLAQVLFPSNSSCACRHKKLLSVLFQSLTLKDWNSLWQGRSEVQQLQLYCGIYK
jgi:hypothetical protein